MSLYRGKPKAADQKKVTQNPITIQYYADKKISDKNGAKRGRILPGFETNSTPQNHDVHEGDILIYHTETQNQRRTNANKKGGAGSSIYMTSSVSNMPNYSNRTIKDEHDSIDFLLETTRFGGISMATEGNPYGQQGAAALVSGTHSLDLIYTEQPRLGDWLEIGYESADKVASKRRTHGRLKKGLGSKIVPVVNPVKPGDLRVGRRVQRLYKQLMQNVTGVTREQQKKRYEVMSTKNRTLEPFIREAALKFEHALAVLASDVALAVSSVMDADAELANYISYTTNAGAVLPKRLVQEFYGYDDDAQLRQAGFEQPANLTGATAINFLTRKVFTTKTSAEINTFDDTYNELKFGLNASTMVVGPTANNTQRVTITPAGADVALFVTGEGVNRIAAINAGTKDVDALAEKKYKKALDIAANEKAWKKRFMNPRTQATRIAVYELFSHEEGMGKGFKGSNKQFRKNAMKLVMSKPAGINTIPKRYRDSRMLKKIAAKTGTGAEKMMCAGNSLHHEGAPRMMGRLISPPNAEGRNEVSIGDRPM